MASGDKKRTHNSSPVKEGDATEQEAQKKRVLEAPRSQSRAGITDNALSSNGQSGVAQLVPSLCLTQALQIHSSVLQKLHAGEIDSPPSMIEQMGADQWERLEISVGGRLKLKRAAKAFRTNNLASAMEAEATAAVAPPSPPALAGLTAAVLATTGPGLPIPLTADQQAQQALLASVQGALSAATAKLMTSSTSPNKWIAVVNLYNKRIANDTAGSAKVLKNATKRVQFQDLCSALKYCNRNATPKIELPKSNLQKLFSKLESNDLKSGVYSAFVAITSQDTLHLINSILMANGGDMPTVELECTHRLMTGQTTGKRSGESLWTAAASFSLKLRLKDPNGIIESCRMGFLHCYQKGTGAGIFNVAKTRSRSRRR